MARGKPIPKLEETIVWNIRNKEGSTAQAIHENCEKTLEQEILLSTVNSALSRLLREGAIRKESPPGGKIPFNYYPTKKEKGKK